MKLFTLLIFVLFNFLPLLATADDAQLIINSPQEGEIIRDSDFDLLMQFEGDTEGAGLDHVHVKLDDGDNDTAPDLSGVYSFTDVPDGIHTITTYMATADHDPINGKKTVTFRVMTTGITFITPTDATPVRSSSVPLSFSWWGPIPEDISHYIITVGESEEFLDGNAREGVIGPLSNGEHTIAIRAMNNDGEVIGIEVETSCRVRSALTARNVRKSISLLRKQTSQHTQRALRTLQRMRRGGSVSASHTALNRSRIRRAIRMIHAQRSNSRVARFLRKLIRSSS